MRLVSDEGYNHAVEVEEEHDEMEAELDERFLRGTVSSCGVKRHNDYGHGFCPQIYLFVYIELSEDFCCI